MKYYTLPLRIEHDDRNLRVSFGDTVLLDTAPTPEPDRITITLTEREAELLRSLVCRGMFDNGVYGDHMWLVCCQLHEAGFRYSDDIFSTGISRGKEEIRRGASDAYAHAERLGGVHGDIRLTMDRDVAVTLYELICRVEPRGKLCGVFDKLTGAGAYTMGGDPDRFTGTIKWKKRRLKTYELTPGKTYRLLGDNRAMDVYEWEPVE